MTLAQSLRWQCCSFIVLHYCSTPLTQSIIKDAVIVLLPLIHTLVVAQLNESLMYLLDGSIRLDSSWQQHESWPLLPDTQNVHILHVQVCPATVVDMRYTIAVVSALRIPVCKT